jgi:hypothetical protein
VWKKEVNTNASGFGTNNLMVGTWLIQCFDDMKQKKIVIEHEVPLPYV